MEYKLNLITPCLYSKEGPSNCKDDLVEEFADYVKHRADNEFNLRCKYDRIPGLAFIHSFEDFENRFLIHSEYAVIIASKYSQKALNQFIPRLLVFLTAKPNWQNRILFICLGEVKVLQNLVTYDPIQFSLDKWEAKDEQSWKSLFNLVKMTLKTGHDEECGSINIEEEKEQFQTIEEKRNENHEADNKLSFKPTTEIKIFETRSTQGPSVNLEQYSFIGSDMKMNNKRSFQDAETCIVLMNESGDERNLYSSEDKSDYSCEQTFECKVASSEQLIPGQIIDDESYSGPSNDFDQENATDPEISNLLSDSFYERLDQKNISSDNIINSHVEETYNANIDQSYQYNDHYPENINIDLINKEGPENKLDSPSANLENLCTDYGFNQSQQDKIEFENIHHQAVLSENTEKRHEINSQTDIKNQDSENDDKNIEECLNKNMDTFIYESQNDSLKNVSIKSDYGSIDNQNENTENAILCSDLQIETDSNSVEINSDLYLEPDKLTMTIKHDVDNKIFGDISFDNIDVKQSEQFVPYENDKLINVESKIESFDVEIPESENITNLHENEKKSTPNSDKRYEIEISNENEYDCSSNDDITVKKSDQGGQLENDNIIKDSIMEIQETKGLSNFNEDKLKSGVRYNENIENDIITKDDISTCINYIELKQTVTLDETRNDQIFKDLDAHIQDSKDISNLLEGNIKPKITYEDENEIEVVAKNDNDVCIRNIKLKPIDKHGFTGNDNSDDNNEDLNVDIQESKLKQNITSDENNEIEITKIEILSSVDNIKSKQLDLFKNDLIINDLSIYFPEKRDFNRFKESELESRTLFEKNSEINIIPKYNQDASSIENIKLKQSDEDENIENDNIGKDFNVEIEGSINNCNFHEGELESTIIPKEKSEIEIIWEIPDQPESIDIIGLEKSTKYDQSKNDKIINYLDEDIHEDKGITSVSEGELKRRITSEDYKSDAKSKIDILFSMKYVESTKKSNQYDQFEKSKVSYIDVQENQEREINSRTTDEEKKEIMVMTKDIVRHDLTENDKIIKDLIADIQENKDIRTVNESEPKQSTKSDENKEIDILPSIDISQSDQREQLENEQICIDVKVETIQEPLDNNSLLNINSRIKYEEKSEIEIITKQDYSVDIGNIELKQVDKLVVDLTENYQIVKDLDEDFQESIGINTVTRSESRQKISSDVNNKTNIISEFNNPSSVESSELKQSDQHDRFQNDQIIKDFNVDHQENKDIRTINESEPIQRISSDENNESDIISKIDSLSCVDTIEIKQSCQQNPFENELMVKGLDEKIQKTRHIKNDNGAKLKIITFDENNEHQNAFNNEIDFSIEKFIPITEDFSKTNSDENTFEGFLTSTDLKTNSELHEEKSLSEKLHHNQLILCPVSLTTENQSLEILRDGSTIFIDHGSSDLQSSYLSSLMGRIRSFTGYFYTSKPTVSSLKVKLNENVSNQKNRSTSGYLQSPWCALVLVITGTLVSPYWIEVTRICQFRIKPTFKN